MNPKIESPSSAETSSKIESAATESAATESAATESAATESAATESTITENSDGVNLSSSKPNPFRNLGIQDYLWLGYISLLGVGIMTDAIYDKRLGVNILHFTSVLEVLVSPIAFMAKRPIIIVFLVLLPFLFDGLKKASD